jgi:ribulose-5-phosphate 4-epimerase/fuculose-1-phosphate aldolase
MSKMSPDSEFKNFLKQIGSDFMLTQGLGGNSSIKSRDLMFVKASGKRLGDVECSGYFYEVGISNGEYHEIKSPQDGKPSIEVFLHALLPFKYVVHLHSTKGVALSMLAAKDSGVRSNLITQGVSLVEYRKPGIDLKEAVRAKLVGRSEEAPFILFLLQNHGTLFGANSVRELRESVLSFERNAEVLLGNRLELKLTPDSLPEILDADFSEHVAWHARNNWRISPDHVVFLGANPPKAMTILSSPVTVLEILKKVFPQMKRIGTREEQLLWFINVVQFLPKEKFPTISEEDAMDLISWEAEKHRVEASNYE